MSVLNMNEELIDMKSIPIDERPNIGVQDMDKYKNGGLTVESLEANGALVYIPYGIYVDIFHSIDNGSIAIKQKIEDIKEFQKEMLGCNGYSQEMIDTLKRTDDFLIEVLKRDMSILKTVCSMVNKI